MRCKFPEQDLSQRLDNTLCLYKEHPYFVRYGGSSHLKLWKLDQAQQVAKYPPECIIEASDPVFDVSTPSLGYVQVTPKKVAYVRRKPIRNYKQGLTNDVVAWDQIPDETTLMYGGSNLNIYTQAFEDMIVGNYPDTWRVFQHFDSGPSENIEVAISKDVAVHYNPDVELMFVYYKHNRTGYALKGSRRVIVPSRDDAWIISKNLQGFGWEIE